MKCFGPAILMIIIAVIAEQVIPKSMRIGMSKKIFVVKIEIEEDRLVEVLESIKATDVEINISVKKNEN